VASQSATALAVWATSPTTPNRTARCAPIAAGSSSTCTTVAERPISFPCRVVHMFSEQPHPTTTSAPPISSAASGEANPPLTSRSHGLPRNSPLAAAEVASSAPHSSAARSRSPRAPRAPRPAMNTGCLASRSVRASRPTASGDAPGLSTLATGVTGGGGSHCAAWTSSGSERITVRRPTAACQARATSAAADAGDRT
jgi:hypothetical protein